MRTVRYALCAICTVLGLAAVTSPAESIPAFARKYGLNCSTCHQMNPPRLNALGRHFQERGFQMPEGAERPAAAGQYRRQDEQLALLDRLPLALRIKNAAFIRNQKGHGENRFEFNAPLEIHMLAGGALFYNASFFVNFPIFTNGSVGAPILAYVQLNQLTGADGVNLRVGKFNILGFQFPSHRGLTVTTPAAPSVRVGLNPVALDDHQIGAKLFGRPGNGPVFYELALVTGAGPQEEAAADHGTGGGHAHGGSFSTDANDFKDIFGRLVFNTRDRQHRIGVLGYFDKTPLVVTPMADGQGADEHGDDHGIGTNVRRFFQKDHADDDHGGEEAHGAEEAPAAALRANDRFRILGVDVDLNGGALSLRGAFYFGHHSNPFGTGGSADYKSALGELSYAFSRRLLGMVHYDQVFSSDLPSLEQRSVMPHLSYLFLDNLRLSVEYHIDLDDFDRSRTFFLIDVTM